MQLGGLALEGALKIAGHKSLPIPGPLFLFNENFGFLVGFSKHPSVAPLNFPKLLRR